MKMHWIDHDFLPDIGGAVERFIINRHGEVDGLILMYEPARFLFVHLPPHLGPEITSAVAPGDAVRVRGIRPRGADMIAAVAVIATDGRLILDNGPDGKGERKPQPRQEDVNEVEFEGVVRMSLFGPKGELRGALLEDGNLVRLGPKEAILVTDLLRPGAAIAARGEGLESTHGTVVSAADIGPDLARLRPIVEGPHEPKAKAASADASPGAPVAVRVV
jgi:hypothetical protein